VVPTAKLLSLTDSSAEFVFEGRFDGGEVIWQCELHTLASLAQGNRQSSQRQFIEIQPQQPDSQQQNKPVLQIMIGLNVPKIDAAVIEKTRIMIRNYKRLQTGRHEYGEQFEIMLD
jgi:hypothetical protein